MRQRSLLRPDSKALDRTVLHREGPQDATPADGRQEDASRSREIRWRTRAAAWPALQRPFRPSLSSRQHPRVGRARPPQAAPLKRGYPPQGERPRPKMRLRTEPVPRSMGAQEPPAQAVRERVMHSDGHPRGLYGIRPEPGVTWHKQTGQGLPQQGLPKAPS